jgi:hypothetical protein
VNEFYFPIINEICKLKTSLIIFFLSDSFLSIIFSFDGVLLFFLSSLFFGVAKEKEKLQLQRRRQKRRTPRRR